MPVLPIWKDVFVTLGQTDTIYYRIVLADSGDVIYSGTSHRRPGMADNVVCINDICADWLQSALPEFTQAHFTDLPSPDTFIVKASTDGTTWTDIGTYQFANDWSYDYGHDPATMGMCRPINGRVDARMPIVWTGPDLSEVTATITFKDGTTMNVIVVVEISPDFNSDFNDDFARSVRSARTGTAVFLLDDWTNVDSIAIGGVTYKVVTECASYALYYVNAHGGWDCFLIEGNVIESDTLKRYTMEVEYDNRDISNRGIRNYVNEVTKEYTIHTGWILGDGGERMHHLINSTEVYLYDIAAGRMIPVTIPATDCEYKTFRNQGNRPVRYTIVVQEAHNRIRR